MVEELLKVKSQPAAKMTVMAAMAKVPWPEKGRYHHKIVVVGGGLRGVGVTAMLRQQGMTNLTLIEPQANHYYQPGWLLAVGGIRLNTKSVCPLKSILPQGVVWMQNHVELFSPEQNVVWLNNGTMVDYDYLVMAAGIKTEWDKVPSVIQGLRTEGSRVGSVYDYNYCVKTWHEFQNLKKTAE